mgnify:CR=1 FL=1
MIAWDSIGSNSKFYLSCNARGTRFGGWMNGVKFWPVRMVHSPGNKPIPWKISQNLDKTRLVFRKGWSDKLRGWPFTLMSQDRVSRRVVRDWSIHARISRVGGPLKVSSTCEWNFSTALEGSSIPSRFLVLVRLSYPWWWWSLFWHHVILYTVYFKRETRRTPCASNRLSNGIRYNKSYHINLYNT